MLLGWLIAGAAIGWTTTFAICELFHPKTYHAQAKKPALNRWQDRFIARLSRFLSEDLYKRLCAEYNTDISPIRRPKIAQAVLLLIAMSLTILFLITLIIDDLIDKKIIYEIESVIYRERLICLMLGIIAGFALHKYPALYSILPLEGAGEERIASKSWRVLLYIAIAISAILLFKPQLLDRIESFKAGDVEAKFSRQQTTAAAAAETIRLKSQDIYESESIDSWVSFIDDYAGRIGNVAVCANSYDVDLVDDHSSVKSEQVVNGTTDPVKFATARRAVLKDLSDSDRDINRKRLNIACRLFLRLGPSIRDLIDKNHSGETALIRRDEEMLALSFKLRNFLLKPADEDSLNSIISAFNIVDRRKCHFAIYAGCSPDAAISTDAKDLFASVDSNQANIGPYIVGLIGDMLGFFSNADEEADFLNIVKSRYPIDLSHLHPGIANLYSAAATAKLRSEAVWSIEDILSDFEKAEIMNEAIIKKATSSLRDSNKCLQKNKTEDTANDEEQKDIRLCRIVDAYLQNRINLDKEHLQMHIEYQAKGAASDEIVRADWLRHYQSLAAAANATSDDGDAPRVDKLTLRNLSVLERGILARAEIHPDDKFNWYAYLALSTVMLDEGLGSVSKQACSVANYYISKATDQIDLWAIEKFGQLKSLPIKDFEETFELKQKGFLRALKHRIDASCARD